MTSFLDEDARMALEISESTTIGSLAVTPRVYPKPARESDALGEPRRG